MFKTKDMTGLKFGSWTVLSFSHIKSRQSHWNCKCGCGSLKTVSGSHLRRGESLGCNCCRDYTKQWEPEIIDDSTLKIPLSKGKYALIDKEDFDKIKDYGWSLSRGYAVSCINEKTVMMHRLIMGFPSKGIDHVNREKSDNRKQNLRLSDQSENMRNRPAPINSSTGLKGVTPKKNKFLAQITHHYKNIRIGLFNTAVEAHEAYNSKARGLQGEFFFENKNNITKELVL